MVPAAQAMCWMLSEHFLGKEKNEVDSRPSMFRGWLKCFINVITLFVYLHREKNFSKSDIVGSSVSAFAFSPSGN